MSTILKALRRLEQEKSTRSDRPLGEAVAGAAPVPPPPPAGLRRWPMFAGIAIGVIVLGAAAFAAIQWSRGGEPAPVEVAAVPVEPEVPAVVGRRLPAPPRPNNNRSTANRRLRQARNARPEPSAPSELPLQTAEPRAAAVVRTPPKPASRLGASQAPETNASAVSPGWTDAHRPLGSPVTPSLGESPVIDLSRLEALQAAAKSARKSPEPIASAAVAPTPPAPTPEEQPAPVEAAVARRALEPVPTSAPSTAAKAEPTPKAEAKPDAEAKREPQPPRSIARKSPPRPSSARPQPKIYVSRTVWHPDASRRIAYVEFDGRDGIVVLREGDSIGPLLVKEIAPTEVSFDNRGSELTRRVGAR